jgi:hypothetical protein
LWDLSKAVYNFHANTVQISRFTIQLFAYLSELIKCKKIRSAFSFPSNGGTPNRAQPNRPSSSSLTFPQDDGVVKVTRSIEPQPFKFPNSQRQQTQFASPLPAEQHADDVRTQRGLRFPPQQQQQQEGSKDQDAAAGGNKETRHVNFGADYDAGYDDYGGGGGHEEGYGGGGGGGYNGGGGYGHGGYGDYGDQGHGFGQPGVGQGGGYPVPGAGGYPHGGADYDEGAAGYGDGHYP